MNEVETSDYERPNPFSAGLRMKCPGCGKGSLFEGFLKVRDRCADCDQDFASHDTGDGPAVFIMLIASTLVLVPAFIVEFVYSPPYWVYGVTAVPLLVGLSLGLLRPAKALMFALQFHYKAAEGEASEGGGDEL